MSNKKAPGQVRKMKLAAASVAEAAASGQVAARPLIVGIGASAGGLDAFKTFFTNMAPDSGMAFVLVQHLSPTHKSLLADLLGKSTSMTVREAENGMSIAANCVYVIPPDATLMIRDRALAVDKPAPVREHRRPIDTFFISLAEQEGENAVCIILSGTGSDGTLGLTAIKEHGGLTFAQAEFDHHAMSGMPHSAAATGLVDHVLPVEKMPAMLVEYQQHLAKLAGPEDSSDQNRAETAAHLAMIATQLRTRTGHDFSRYKDKTLVRRIHRRLQVLRLETFPAYIAHLTENPGELDVLFRELLIGVTKFFRDPAAFEALRSTVIAKLIEKKGVADSMRIWVPACATGEEVYSITILVREEMMRQGKSLKLQVFGTDIGDRAVANARAARYPLTIAGVSPERIKRWFTSEGNVCSPIREIRDACVFSTHSVIKDPPFSKLDLISCRNLLIYLDGELQSHLIRTFHHALRPEGFLFLGSSEGLSRHANLFTPLDKKHRIFARVEVRAALPPPLPTPARVLGQPKGAVSMSDDRIDRSARRALEKYSPVYVVIDQHHGILRFSGSAIGDYLGPSPGMASLNLFDILRKPLRPVVRAALQAMFATKEAVARTDVVLKIAGKNRAITVIAAPLAETGADAGLCVIAFQDGPLLAPRSVSKSGDGAIDSQVQALDQELQATKAQLHATINEFETINEEMKSANEEFQSVNEELQSTNEELETSKEEMQSVNEELHTINTEMGRKNELLTVLNSDLKNLFESTDIATIFLDNDLLIKSFTPGMTEIFRVREADRGRPITDIVTLLSYADLKRDVKQVLHDVSIIEHEVEIAERGATYIMRIRPYRTVANVIDGVVITFVDISERKKTDDALHDIHLRLQFALDAARVGDWDLDLVNDTSRRSLRHDQAFGYSEPIADWGFANFIKHVHPDDRASVEQQFHDAVEKRTEWHPVCRVIWPDGSLHWIEAHGTVYRTLEGKPTHMLGIVANIDDRKKQEAQVVFLMREVNHRSKNMLAVVQAVARQTAVGDPKTFTERLGDRIQALSASQDLLISSNWKSVDLSALVHSQLAHFAELMGARVKTKGPALRINALAAQPISMALHELATNAVKHGALANSTGKVEISWKVEAGEPEALFKISWVERGGPTVAIPSRKGFGFTVIGQMAELNLEAEVHLNFAPSGLTWHLECPVGKILGRE